MMRSGSWSRRAGWRLALVAILWLTLSMPALAEDGSWLGASFTVVDVDRQPPERIEDLAVAPGDDGDLVLTWTAPSDDGPLGRAARYEIRYSTAPIETWQDWLAATVMTRVPLPASAGATESASLLKHDPTEPLYFVITSVDDSGNWAALSPWATTTILGGGEYVVAIPLVVNAGAAEPAFLPLFLR